VRSTVSVESRNQTADIQNTVRSPKVWPSQPPITGEKIVPAKYAA